jgi:LysM repeat protein
MKQFISVMMSLTVLVFAARVQAQTGNFIVQRNAAGLFLTHTVAPKENFYSIGRLYNISPKVIAPFNGLDLNGGLSVGQVIKIPLKPQNFSSSREKVAGEVLVPLYRMDGEKRLAAGYLKVVKGQSALANGSTYAAPAQTGVAQAAPPQVGAAAPAGAAVVTTAAVTDAPKKANAKPKAPPPPVPVPPVKADSPSTPAETTASAPVPQGASSPDAGGPHYNGEGSFHTDYMSQTDNGRKIRSSSGLAGVFKSTSGWDNGKFYALMNHVERGTVVKVTNLSNNKVVFVKVLSDIADIKQNSGMVIVLSDAAVSQLGVGTDRFTAEVTYAK